MTTDRAVDKPTVSVVLPLHDDEETVLNLVDEFHQHVTAKIPGAEIVAVDAGSRDHTWGILRELTTAYDELKIYRSKEPVPPGGASLRGFIEAAGKFVFHREPHCPWRADLFWDMARLRANAGQGAVFATRGPSLRGMKEKVSDRLFRDEALEELADAVPDTGFPAQLFAKSDFDKIQILLPQNLLAPGLTLFLLFQSFNRQLHLLTPDGGHEVARARRAAPAFFTSVASFRDSVRQVQELRRNMRRIQGLMDLR
jgi:hypothetical protein